MSIFQTAGETRLSNDFVQQHRCHLAHHMSEDEADSVVGTVIVLINDQKDWDYALDQVKALDNSIKSAKRFGVSRPFTPEQDQLHDYLSERFAGVKMANYAWGLYADMAAPKAA